MASYLLLNTVNLGTTIFPAGSPIDGNADPIDQLRAGGAVLLPLSVVSPSLIAGAGRALQARQRGASYPTLDQIMLSALAADTVRLGGGSVFVYRAGGGDEPNVFDSFEEALFEAKQRTPSSIQFEQGLATLRIPAKPGGGAWDVTGVAFLGGTQTMPSVFCEDGAQLRGLGYVNNVSLTSLSSLPIIEVTDGQILTLDNASTLRTDTPASAPFIHAGSTISLFFLALRYFSTLYSFDPGAPGIDADLGAFVAIAADLAAGIYPNTLAGNGSYLVDDLTTTVQAQRNLNISHTQLAGDITYTYG